MLLSCEAAVRRQISCTRPTLMVNTTLPWQRRAHFEVRTGFPVETLQKGPQSEERASLCGSLSLSDSSRRWKMVSINSSEQHGWLCREESWGRGNGSVQRSAAHDYDSLLQPFPLAAVADAAEESTRTGPDSAGVTHLSGGTPFPASLPPLLTLGVHSLLD